MKTVLLTSIGSVASDIAIKSLHRMGFRVVGADIYPKPWVVDANFVDQFYQIPLVSNSEDYLDAIHHICVDEHVNYFIPLIDPEVDLLNNSREWFAEHDVQICISPKESLDTIRNKKILADFIQEHCPDIQWIPTMYARDIKKLPWNYPIVCKPYNGRSSQGRVYINNQMEWETYLQTADMEYSSVEPYIEGYLVMVEIVRSAMFDQCVAISRRELISTPHGCATTVQVFQDLDIEERSKKLAKALDINGNVNFEYIVDPDGKYHFVECNPRFSAGVEFACMAGYDIVGNHIRCFSGHPIDQFTFHDVMTIARKYEEFITSVGMDC